MLIVALCPPIREGPLASHQGHLSMPNYPIQCMLTCAALLFCCCNHIPLKYRYLVPAVLLTPIMLAVVRGELTQLFAYDEEALMEEEKKEEEAKKAE